jgi:hypothetical protein
MTNEARQEFDEQDDSQEVAFHFIKSNFFRVIHVDGMWGGMTPNGNIHITLYNERGAIPKRLVFGFEEDGTLTDEILKKRESRGGIVREVESELVMDLETAKGFRDWIINAVSEVEEYQKEWESES